MLSSAQGFKPHAELERQQELTHHYFTDNKRGHLRQGDINWLRSYNHVPQRPISCLGWDRGGRQPPSLPSPSPTACRMRHQLLCSGQGFCFNVPALLWTLLFDNLPGPVLWHRSLTHSLLFSHSSLSPPSIIPPSTTLSLPPHPPLSTKQQCDGWAPISSIGWLMCFNWVMHWFYWSVLFSIIQRQNQPQVLFLMATLTTSWVLVFSWAHKALLKLCW